MASTQCPCSPSLSSVMYGRACICTTADSSLLLVSTASFLDLLLPNTSELLCEFPVFPYPACICWSYHEACFVLLYYSVKSGPIHNCIPLCNPKFIRLLKHWHKHKHRRWKIEKKEAYKVDLYRQITSLPSMEAIKRACEATAYRTEIEVV